MDHKPRTRIKAIEDLQAGDHLCCLYETEAEQASQVISFLLQGLEQFEKVVYFTDGYNGEILLERLHKETPGIETFLDGGQLQIDSTSESYLRAGVFDADRMIAHLQSLERRALAEGFDGLRVAAEATWLFRGQVDQRPSSELESKLDQFLPLSSSVLLIQYDRWAFDPSFLLDVLSSHPVVAVGNDVYENIYYLPHWEQQKKGISSTTLRLWLENLKSRQREDDILRASEANFRTIFDASADAMFVMDTRGTAILDANRRAQDLFGYSLEEFKRLTAESLIHADSLHQLEKTRQIYRKTRPGESRLLELLAKRSDGQPFWVEVNFRFTNINGEERMLAVARDISKRKRVEEELRKSEKRHRTLVEALQEGVWMIDGDAVTTFVNQAMADMLGYSVGEMLGRSLYGFMDDAGMEIARINFERRVHGIMEQHDFELLRKDGSKVYTTMETSPIKDDDGRFVGAIAGVLDISKRRQMEEELKDSEEKYRGLYDSVKDGIVMVDMEGHILQCNQAFLDMLGCTETEIRGMTYSEITPEKWHGTEERIVENQLLVRGHSDEYEKEFVRMDGTVIPVSLRTWLILDKLAEPTGMWGIVRDITEQKGVQDDLRVHQVELEMQNDELRVAQRELERSRNIYVDLYDFAPVGYMSLDEQGLITEVNLACAAMLGSERVRLIGTLFVAHLAGDDRGRFRDHLVRCKQADTKVTTSLSLKGQEGHQIEVELTCIPFRNPESGDVYLRTSIVDVTERKQMEEKLRASLEEKEVLLQEIHHRVKNNLQIISNLLSIQSHQIDDQRITRLLEESQNRIKSISLIHEKLYQSEDLSRVDFAEYVSSLVLDLFHAYHVDRTLIGLEVTANDLSILSDTAITCGLIIVELVSNSLKHAFPAGRPGKIDIYLRQQGERMVLTIGDDGIGLPEGFDPGKASSMGLQLVCIHVRLLHGTLENTGGPGSRFEVTFPTSPPV